MFGWFRSLMPREDKFFDLFAQHSRTLVAGAGALEALLAGGDATSSVTQKAFGCAVERAIPRIQALADEPATLGR